MMKLLLILSFLAAVSCEKFRFDNYSLFKIVPDNNDQIKLLQDLQENDLSYDFWSDPVPNAPFVSIMADPLKKTQLENWLNYHGMRYEITMSNVQEAINKETVKSYTRNNIRSISWDAYYTLEDIEAWMSDMAAAYSNVATEIVGGISHEGRNITGLKISHGSGRKVIFVESGIHSREWIAMSTACFIINELLTSTDPWTMAAARDFDWYIFPVTNPDGYVWTHTNFRMWRKNRRNIVNNIYGVDLNRNWNNNWLAQAVFSSSKINVSIAVIESTKYILISTVIGASTNPSSDTYAGPGPFSEIETRTLSAFIRDIDNIEMYLSFHSFTQLLLLPFGNSTAGYANYADAVNIGRRAMGALSVRYGTTYRTGNVAATIANATGGSIDWVKGTLQVPLVYCYELRDQGQTGFLLPPEQILPNNLEVMDSLLELIHQGRRFGYFNGNNCLQVSVFLLVFATLSSIFYVVL